MINLDLHTSIDRPMKDVFSFIADPNNMAKWNSAVVSIQPLSPGASGVGTKFKTVGEMLGRRMEGELQVTANEPEHTCGFQMNAGPLQVNIIFTLKAMDIGTQLDFNVQGNPAGVFKLAEGVMAGQVRSMMEANLARLKSLLEKGMDRS